LGGDAVLDCAADAHPTNIQRPRQHSSVPDQPGFETIRGQTLTFLLKFPELKRAGGNRSAAYGFFFEGWIEKATHTQQLCVCTPEVKVMDERRKQILATLAQMDKQFGKGSVLMLGSKAALPVEVITTGSIAIDSALGAGGLPRGRVIEIFGPESSGKTTLALHVVAEAQRTGGNAAFIDAEHALDPTYAAKLGVDIENLVVSQPDYGEQALEIAQALVNSQAVDVVVVDSVAALTPKAEIEGEMGDSHMGLHARMMSQALRKLTASVSRANTCLIFINQLREKIGVMFGNPETTTGGRALKFYASVRAEVRRMTAIKDGENVVGNRTKIKIVKNKVAAPFREVEVDILYGKGISRESDVLDLGVQHAIIEKSGSWFSYKGERIGQGRENARQLLIDRPELRQTIEGEIRRALGMDGSGKKAEFELTTVA
jgi:recombination protein RecA